jgi:hypothetical protein
MAKSWGEYSGLEKVGAGCSTLVLGGVFLIMALALWPSSEPGDDGAGAETPSLDAVSSADAPEPTLFPAEGTVEWAWNDITSDPRTCDSGFQMANRSIAAAGKSKSDAQIYKLFRLARDDCRDTVKHLLKIVYPDIAAPLVKRWKEIRDRSCLPGYRARLSAIEKFMEAIDAGVRISDGSDYDVAIRAADQDIYTCITALREVASQAGQPLPKMVGWKSPTEMMDDGYPR